MGEFSWAYISGGVSTEGPDGSVQFKSGDSALSGTGNFTYDSATDLLALTGSMEISGTLTASANISASAFYGDGSGLTAVSAVATPAGSNTEIQFNNAGSLGASANLTWDGSALDVVGTAMITGSLELTGSTQSLITLHTRDADSLKEIAFLKDGSPAAAIQINSAEHLFIENENAKDIILRASNLNTLRVIGSQRRVIVGAVSKTTANAELDVEGSAIVSGTLTTTDDISVPDDTKLNLGDSADALIEFDSGIGRLAISGSATGIELMGGSIGIDYPGGAVASGSLAGAGSYLGLNSSHQIVLTSSAGGGADPFPFIGNAQITGGLAVVSGSTQVFGVDGSDAALGGVRGRMVQHIRSGFSLTSGAQAKTGRYISLGASPATVSTSLSNSNVMITPFSGRLISVTYHFPAAALNQDQSKGQPQWELWVGDVNALKGQTLTNAVSLVAQATASTWPGTNIVGGFDVQTRQGTLGGTNSTGSWSFGTGSVVALKFKSGDTTGTNYPGASTMTTVWEFDQLDPYISGSGN